ncbi:MAG: TIGR01459 family HAD-type hydrolase, partial [Alphaproteobacteria bacterium]|nr:TIGR01459 family HAD-type hydrolase [Alphaproteobacteria bacterium]
MSSTTTILTGLAAVAHRYDAFILDLWGCVHDGLKPYPGVPGTLAAMRAAAKKVLMLSNVPRRVAPVKAMLAGMGIGPELYDVVLSSGESAWRGLAARGDEAHRRLGRVGFHLGPDRDTTIYDADAALRTTDPLAADFVLCTGPLADYAPLEDYEALLSTLRGRDLPMLCANPDLWVMRGDKRLICAGLLAQRYEQLGGHVTYHGKPHAPIYAMALELLGGLPKRRVLCVGDGVLTDIAGANAAGLDSALIPGGIHGEPHGLFMGEMPEPGRLAALLSEHEPRPTY